MRVIRLTSLVSHKGKGSTKAQTATTPRVLTSRLFQTRYKVGAHGRASPSNHPNLQAAFKQNWYQVAGQKPGCLAQLRLLASCTTSTFSPFESFSPRGCCTSSIMFPSGS